MAVDLSKVSVRQGLKPKREPYWHRLRAGCFIGYRPSKSGDKGTWIARAYDQDTQKYKLESLGDYGDLAKADMFAQAKKDAEAIAVKVEGGGVHAAKTVTVKDACREYAVDHPEAEGRFKRFVYSDPIAHIMLDRLRKHHVSAWRKRLSDTPAQVSRRKRGDQETRPRALSTINRDMAPLRAALTKVLALGSPSTDKAWQEALRPAKGVDGQRTLYLDIQQRRQLVNHASKEAKPFVRALCLLPLRPGALAALSAHQFDSRTRALTIGKDKNGKPRQIRLPPGAAQLLSANLADKNPADPIFVRSNGKRWSKESWNDPITQAAEASGLPKGITAYTLRHSTITDLAIGGLALLSIAQISGTSVAMIEKHYGHLVGDGAEEALATLDI